jgi:hypothetical protein
MFLKNFSPNMIHSISNTLQKIFFIPCVVVAQSGTMAQQSVGLLWTSDQFVAETATLQHPIFTTEKNHL